ncbi:hypothetical protein SASPL_157882 [Salvia splendens]|uniref:Uncharacterized protein n=1 Tax=Salvia splendens TaxID=180675 RepID=A0A8X8VU71_SALSN|nr:hypothetical protein SASPL_157882 [Salvia splendens]
MLEGETLTGLSSPSMTATPPPAKKMQEIDEIEESQLENSRNEVEFEVNEGEIVEEESNVKKIKKHIDLHSQ